MNKRGTYGIIADDLRFDTQLSNVYGNAIRAKLAAAQTTRSVAGSFSSFVTQNLQSICSLYHRHPRFFHKSSESDSIANTGIPSIRHTRCQKLFLFSLSVTKHKCAFSAVQVLYQIYKLNLSVFMSGNFFLYRVLCCEKLYSYS